jgi:hypothetical protein
MIGESTSGARRFIEELSTRRKPKENDEELVVSCSAGCGGRASDRESGAAGSSAPPSGLCPFRRSRRSPAEADLGVPPLPRPTKWEHADSRCRIRVHEGCLWSRSPRDRRALLHPLGQGFWTPHRCATVSNTRSHPQAGERRRRVAERGRHRQCGVPSPWRRFGRDLAARIPRTETAKTPPEVLKWVTPCPSGVRG